MCEMPAFNRRDGFSLIELLVVLLIVTILLAIVIPVVGSARRSAKSAACASNLRQIGQAIQTYRSEFRHWPDACPMPAPFTVPGESVARSVPEVIAAYLPANSKVYRCPGDAQVYDQCAAQPGGFGISYFYWIPFELPKPHQMMMNDYQGFSSPAGTVTVPEFHPPRRGMNTLKIDGSVEFGFANAGGR